MRHSNTITFESEGLSRKQAPQLTFAF
ncbi:hypothetical protein MPLA_720068 [Mesorhizobium sp. ORS 3359]|nr:hypothetical protein MPLA_720068 [Mesorhizobium sp. ORS 3359]